MNANNSAPSLKLPQINTGEIHECNTKGTFKYKGFKDQKYSSIGNNIVHYVSDGSGRDKYIKLVINIDFLIFYIKLARVNEGGLSSNYNGNSAFESYFENNLRNYQKIHRISHKNSHVLAFFPKLQRIKNKEVYKSQVLLDRRLAFPKNIREKSLPREASILNAATVLNTQ